MSDVEPVNPYWIKHNEQNMWICAVNALRPFIAVNSVLLLWLYGFAGTCLCTDLASGMLEKQ